MGRSAYSCFFRVIALGVFVGAGSARANSVWQANPTAPDDWFDASAWNGGVPVSSQQATINNGGEATISAGVANCGELDLGAVVPNASSGTLAVSGGTLQVGNNINVGNMGSGLVDQNGGYVTAHSVNISNNGGNGIYKLSGTSALSAYEEAIGPSSTSPIGNAEFLQAGGSNSIFDTVAIANASYQLSGGQLTAGTITSTGASFSQTGGSVSLTAGLILASAHGTTIYSISNGSSLICAGGAVVGQNGMGFFTQTDSLCNFGTGSLTLAANAGSVGSYTLSGNSQLYSGNQYIGAVGSASFTQSGGTNNLGDLNLGNPSAASTYVLDGSGAISSSNQFISNGSFTQRSGTNSASFINIAPLGRYNFAGGSLQIGAGGIVNNGTLDIQNPADYGSATTNDLIISPTAIAGGGSLIVEPHTSVFAGRIEQGAATIGGALQIAPGTGVSVLSSLALTASGSLDLSNNALVLKANSGPSPLATIRADIYTGYHNHWTGPGLISSTVVGDPVLGIGYATASSLGLISAGGVTVQPNDVLIRYTWVGDANLDGVVNGADMAMMSSTGSTWNTGDFNYNGVVDADDYALFALGYSASGGAPVPVPEPAMAGAAALLMLLPRRRRAE